MPADHRFPPASAHSWPCRLRPAWGLSRSLTRAHPSRLQTGQIPHAGPRSASGEVPVMPVATPPAKVPRRPPAEVA
jgi:hypothetical protein